MNTIFGFENLAAYQRAMDLVDKVYDLMMDFQTEGVCDGLDRKIL